MNAKIKSLTQKILIVAALIIQTALLKNISEATSEGMIILRGILTLGIIFLTAWLLSGSPPGGMTRKKERSKEE